MKKETKKAPTIRFRGFTDDWEQRKLGEIFTERSEKKHEYLPPLTIIQGCGTVRRDEMDRELIYDKSSLSNYKLVKKNDFIVHLRSFEGGLEKSNIEGIVSPAYHIFHGEKINTEFYYSFFRSNDFINHKLVPFVYGIRDGRSIDIAGMKTIKIPYPSVNEQNRIGTLIGQLNSLIALHQRKLAQLKKLKKYFLQNMFPAKGEKVPRIRFKGFTGDWEQRKLGECCDMYNGDRSAKYPNAKDMVSEGIPFINAGDLIDGHVNLSTANKITREKYHDLGGAKLQVGDIVYCLRGTLGKNAYIDNFTEGTVASSLVAIRPKNINGKYLFEVLNSDIEYRQRRLRDEGAAQPNLSAKNVSEFIIPVPNYEEQLRISQYLDKLDNLITLHQHKLDQLQTMKKFMLQNLFI